GGEAGSNRVRQRGREAGAKRAKEGSEPRTDEREPPPTRREHLRKRMGGAARAGKSWGSYGWVMSFGTVLPLPVFLGGYLADVTLIGAPLARQIYRFRPFLPAPAQAPPGEDKVMAKTQGGKKPLAERIRAHSPPGWIERRGKPVSMLVRSIWFVLVGWWAGAIWVLIAWSVLLLPYPLLDLI